MIEDTKMIWFIAGLALILMEFVAPGLVFIFFGIGAWVVAASLWLGLINSIGMQCAVFTSSSLLLLFLLRRFFTSWFVGGTLNQGGNMDEEFVGKKVRVIHAIGGGDETGKVELKGAEWIASCKDPLPAGSHAVVTERDGIHLVVRPSG